MTCCAASMPMDRWRAACSTDPMKHTFPLRPPWISAMAQGEGASLLVRVFQETGDERYAEAAQSALLPLDVDAVDGGARAVLDGRPSPRSIPRCRRHSCSTAESLQCGGCMTSAWRSTTHQCCGLPAGRVNTLARTCTAGTSDTGRATTYTRIRSPTQRAPSTTTCTSTSCARCIVLLRGHSSPRRPSAGLLTPHRLCVASAPSLARRSFGCSCPEIACSPDGFPGRRCAAHERHGPAAG